jgi:hypothetical protein
MCRADRNGSKRLPRHWWSKAMTAMRRIDWAVRIWYSGNVREQDDALWEGKQGDPGTST